MSHGIGVAPRQCHLHLRPEVIVAPGQTVDLALEHAFVFLQVPNLLEHLARLSDTLALQPLKLSARLIELLALLGEISAHAPHFALRVVGALRVHDPWRYGTGLLCIRLHGAGLGKHGSGVVAALGIGQVCAEATVELKVPGGGIGQRLPNHTLPTLVFLDL